MLDNILFSLNVVLPSFIMIFIGWFARKKGVIEKEMMDKVGKLTFTYCLSSRIFLDIYGADFSRMKDLSLTAYCFAATVITFAAIWFLAWKLMKRKESAGAFTQACFRSSFTVLGLSMVRNMAGEEGVAQCASLLTVIVILYNILAVLALTKGGGTSGADLHFGAMLKQIGKKVVVNPLIIAAVLGLPFCILGVQLPSLIQKPIQSLGDLAVPLSLLCIGAALDTSKVKKCFGYASLAALTKTVFLGLTVIPVAALIGFRGLELSVVAILFTTANPSACYVMAMSMDNDSELAATAIVLSTLLSVITTTLALYILKTLALI